jgi:Tfp pilus tip-associated adhesin PilY1
MESGTVTSLKTDDLAALKYLRLTDDIFPEWGVGGEQETVASDAKGWYLQLRPKIIHPTEPTEAEYVTTSPFLYQGVLYVSTYVARTRQPDDDEKCPELGDSKLYALDPVTGKSAWASGAQALVFNNIKIAGISAADGRMFLGIKVLKSGALDVLRRHDDLSGFRTHAEGTTIDFGAMGTGGDQEPNVPYNVPLLQYWKERF